MLVEAVDRLRESVVKTVADAPNRGLDPGRGQALGVANRHVLPTAIRMVHETATLDGSARVKGLLQGIQHEAGVSAPRDPPAYDPTSIGIDHEGHVDEAGPGRDVGEVRDPEHVWARRLELPVDAIERARRGLVADRGPHRLAPHGPLQAHGPHQPRHRAARHPDPLPAELSPDLADAIDPEVLLIHPPDLDHQRCIPPGSRRQPLRIGAPGGMGVIRRWGDRQHAADRLDPVDGAMRVDEGDHGLDRRSSSAWAKYADAFLRISLAWRNSRFSRSSARMRSCSAVVGPARRPWSRSVWRTQPRRVSGAQPILAAIELIAAACEACSPWWSNTIRTARARTSGEYGGMRLVMAPSFQDQEPPENPVRFTSSMPIASPSGLLLLNARRAERPWREPVGV